MSKCLDYSVTVTHGFIGCRPWFTTVSICLLPGKHFRLPHTEEHAKLYLIINAQTGVGVCSQLTTQHEHNAKLSINWRYVWIATWCGSTTQNIGTIQQIFNLRNITFATCIKISTGITIGVPRISYFAAFWVPARFSVLHLWLLVLERRPTRLSPTV